MTWSVIIPTRNEPHLKWTVDNIRRTAEVDEIIIVYDGVQKIEPIDGTITVKTPWVTPQGVGKCRNWGINHASYENIVLLDGHMDFALDWLTVLENTLSVHQNGVICSKSAYIDRNGMKSTIKVNSGAYIRYIGGGTNIPLEVEWGDPLQPGQIQCCLGACYAMKRQRYYDIGAPWANAFGWGTSEQTICMVNEFCGGVNILADCTTGHIYRDNSEIPYEFSIDHKIGRAFNRLRLINMLPMPLKEKVDMLNKASAFRPLKMYTKRADELMRLTDDSDIVGRFTLSWEDYKSRWWSEPAALERQIPQHLPEQQTEANPLRPDRRFI